MSARARQFDREEAAGNAAMELLHELKRAGSWHTARCIPASRCTCEKAPAERRAS